MLKKRFNFLTLLLACACTAVITLAVIMALVQKAAGSSAGGMVFLKTLVTVRDNYVEPVDSEKLFDGATSGMVKALGDPYSAYLDKKSFSEITDLTDGVFGGIGVVLGKKGDDFVVVAPMKGTPGDEAGIKAGDNILAVDGTNVDGMQLEDVVAKIRGKQGTEVELLLESTDGAERTVRVIRGDIKVESVGGQMLPGTKIGYIRISVFNEQTGADFAKKYIELEKEGMQALLLDLRHNPGGILGECVKVAQYIVPKGTVVSIKDRSGNTFVEESNLEKVKYPLAVLVDHGSASAAEIVAGAVQDTGAGKLFGVQTFGKGSVQSVYKLSENTGLKLTTAKYYTPSGRSIHGTGIKPDVEVELDLQSMKDTQLEAAENKGVLALTATAAISLAVFANSASAEDLTKFYSTEFATMRGVSNGDEAARVVGQYGMPNRVVYFTPDKNDESLKQTMMLGYDFPSDGDYEDAGLDFYIDANDRVSKIVLRKDD